MIFLKAQEEALPNPTPDYYTLTYCTSGQGSTWQSFIEQWPSSAQKGHGRFRLTFQGRTNQH